jgi:hypothetical protein
LPLDALVNATQSALELVVQLQLLPTVNANEPLPPAAATFWPEGATAAVHSGVDAGCATVKVCPAIITEAERAFPEFAATFSVTLPEPVPLRGAAIAIQFAVVSALHAHEPSEVMRTATVPPAVGAAALMASSVNWHTAASCAIPTCWSFTSSVPRRATWSTFAATRYATLPSPWPLLADVRAIHSFEDDAAHVQSREVDTVNVPAPPEAATFGDELLTVTEHFEPVGPVIDVEDEPQPAAHTASTPAIKLERTGRRQRTRCADVTASGEKPQQQLTCRYRRGAIVSDRAISAAAPVESGFHLGPYNGRRRLLRGIGATRRHRRSPRGTAIAMPRR